MADKQFIKGAVTGVLCASLVLGGGYVGLQKVGRAGSTVLSDVAVTQKIKYLEDIIDQNYLEDVDEDSLKEGIYTGLLYGLGDPYSRYYTEEEYEKIKFLTADSKIHLIPSASSRFFTAKV